MLFIKNLSLVILSLILSTACANAQTTTGNKNNESYEEHTPSVNVSVENSKQEMQTEYKIVVEGQYSNVDVPFIVVARDAETYALLGKLISNLPDVSTVNFSKTAVVAAFAGEKNKGGFTVAVRPAPGKIAVDLREPGKGEMTTQAIAYPFQVVLIPVSQIQSLPIVPSATWANRMTTYRVTNSNFESSGGIAGRVKTFSVDGTVSALNFGKLVTYQFNLTAGSDQKLTEMVSGAARSGKIELTHLSAWSFGDMPHPLLKATGIANGNNLSFTFESHSAMISDGFMIKGSLEAERNK